MTSIADLIAKRQQRAAEQTAKSSNSRSTKKPASKSKRAQPRPATKPVQDAEPKRPSTPRERSKQPAEAQALVERDGTENRWRQFAKCYVLGSGDIRPFNASACYRAIYPGTTEAAARSSAHALLANPNFQRVLADVAAEVLQRMELTEQDVVRAIAAAADANLVDFFEAAADGTLKLRNLAALPRLVQQSIRKLKVVTRTYQASDGQPPRVEQHVELEVLDRLRALELATRILGLAKAGLDDQSLEVIAALIAKAQERAQRRTVVWDHDSQRAIFTDDGDDGDDDADPRRRTH